MPQPPPRTAVIAVAVVAVAVVAVAFGFVLGPVVVLFDGAFQRRIDPATAARCPGRAPPSGWSVFTMLLSETRTGKDIGTSHLGRFEMSGCCPCSSAPPNSSSPWSSTTQLVSIRSKSLYLTKLYQMSVFLWTVAPLQPWPPPLQLPGSESARILLPGDREPDVLGSVAHREEGVPTARGETLRLEPDHVADLVAGVLVDVAVPDEHAAAGPTGRSRGSRRSPGRPRPCPRRSRRTLACRGRPRRRSRRSRRRRSSRRRS